MMYQNKLSAGHLYLPEHYDEWLRTPGAYFPFVYGNIMNAVNIRAKVSFYDGRAEL